GLIPVPRALYIDPQAFAWILCILGAPHINMVGEHVETWEACLPNGGNDVLGAELWSFHLLLNPILLVNFLRQIRFRVDKLDNAIGLSRSVDEFSLEQQPVRIALTVVFIVSKAVIE